MIELPSDEKGFVGRKCPTEECGAYFKIANNEWFDTAMYYRCPYCGHRDEHDEFHTPEQLAYAESIVVRNCEEDLASDLKRLEFTVEPSGPFGIGMSIKVETDLHPVRLYHEHELETHVECSSCMLLYAVYGLFGFCPNCGHHNSLQVLTTNIGIVSRMLDLSAGRDDDLRRKQIENALGNCVSLLDGFGRELCRVSSSKCSEPAKLKKLSFQNLEGTRQKVLHLFGVDLAAGLTVDEWTTAVRGFQKRHLFAHKLGVIDDEYVERSHDPHAVVGRKVSVSEVEVRQLGETVVKLARYLNTAFTKL